MPLMVPANGFAADVQDTEDLLLKAKVFALSRDMIVGGGGFGLARPANAKTVHKCRGGGRTICNNGGVSYCACDKDWR